MPIDTAVLATTIASSFLLPYVKIGVEKLAEGMAENVGKAAANHATALAKKVWERVNGLFKSQKEQNTLELFKENPDELKGLMEKILRQKLEEDKSLAQELSDMINAPGPDGTSTGAQIMNAGIAGVLDARGANFANASGMNLAGVMLGNPPSQRPTEPKKDR
jgi:hypothetical protein